MSTLHDMIKQNQEFVRSKKDLKLLEKTIELEQGRKNPTLKLIQEIWGMVVGIAGISIPLVAMGGTKALMLPVFAVAGAAVATAFLSKKIAATENTRSSSSPEVIEELRELRQNLADLRSYTMHLEQSIEDKHLRQSIDKASVQAQTPQTHAPQTNSTTAASPVSSSVQSSPSAPSSYSASPTDPLNV